MNTEWQAEFEDGHLEKLAEAKILFEAGKSIGSLRDQWIDVARDYIAGKITENQVVDQRHRIIAIVEQIKPMLDEEGRDLCNQFSQIFDGSPTKFRKSQANYKYERKLSICILQQELRVYEELQERFPGVIAIEMRDSSFIQGSIRIDKFRDTSVETPLWTCSCGSPIDLTTLPDHLRSASIAGEVIRCPGCRKPYKVTQIGGAFGGVREF